MIVATHGAPRTTSLVSRTKRTVEIAGYVWRTSKRLELIQKRIEPKKNGMELVRDTADAGILFIKMAQFLSARSDVISDQDTIDALSKLQNNVPGTFTTPHVPGFDIEPTPIAAASVAAVYKAKVQDTGQTVVVKKVREDVRARVETDLPLLISVLELATMFNVAGAANMLEVVRECVPMINNELDLRYEARSQHALRKRLENVPWVRIPRVLMVEDEYMVSEYVPSRKITDARPNPGLASRLFELYVRMVMEIGLVHADPHAGNVGVLGDGTLVMYDFGAVVDVRKSKAYIAGLLKAIVTEDIDGSIKALGNMGILKSDPSSMGKIRRVIPQVKNMMKSPDFNKALSKLPEFSSNDNRLFELTTKYIYLFRSLVIVQGIILYHDPAFSLKEYLEKYEDIISDLTDVPVWSIAREIASDAMNAPQNLRSVQSAVEDMNVIITEIPTIKTQANLAISMCLFLNFVLALLVMFK